MLINLKLDLKNLKKLKAEASQYKATDAEKALIDLVISNWGVADNVKNKPYREFNDKSLLERQNLDQMRFNTYQEPASEDPDESWKSRAVRPITRNRAISIAAHMTAAVMFPVVHAQNENDEADRDGAMVMRDLVEWAGEQANYEKNVVYAIIAALVNPAVILTTEYAEVWRKVKDGYEDYKENGEKKKRLIVKDVLDELYSGFKDGLVPLDEWWMPDFYQRDVQKQPYIIRRRAITYDIAQSKYGDYKNFKYVVAGKQVMHVDGDNQGQFYQVKDSDLNDQLCEEVCYYDRGRDLEVYFLNGIPMCDPERPNPRLDKKYPFVMFGFEPISDTFAFYKSLVNKMSTDEDVIQTLYRMIIDGTYLQLDPPQAVFGEESIDASVMVPGVTTAFESENTKMQVLSTGANLQAGLSVLQKVESSATESSIDPVMAGQSSGGGGKQPQTAYEISRLEQNARTILGLFGKMIGFAIKELAELRMSDIVQYLSIAEISEITSGMKYKSFLIPEQMMDGKSVSKKIMFDSELPESMTYMEKKKMSFDMYEEEERMGGKQRTVRVNPKNFRKLKFTAKVSPEVILPPSDAIKKALNLEEYDRAIANPLANQEAIFRDLLLGSYSKTASDPDKYITPGQQNLTGMLWMNPMQGSNMNQPGSQEGERAQRVNTLRQQSQSQVLTAGR